MTDAKGATLPAWLKPDGPRLLVQVDDARARYPVTIDPFIQQQKLVPSDGTTGFSDFGPAVSVSGDGNTVVVGAQNAFTGTINTGAAYIFTQAGGVWTEQAKLTASDGVDAEAFGFSSAISGDGNTVVVGKPQGAAFISPGPGAAYVFVKPVAGWTSMTESAKLTASDGVSLDLLGVSSAISGDGNTVAAGAMGAAIGANAQQGAAYIFVKPLGGWVTMTESAKLIASDGAAGDNLGRYVGISGNTVAAGAERADIRFADDDQGAAYIFTQVGGVWTQQAKLTASDGAFNDLFGTSVAISGDSNTVVVGAPRDNISVNGSLNNDQGSAYAFVKPLGGWVTMTETAKLIASDGTAGAQLGESVAVNGATVMAVAPGARNSVNAGTGAAYIFSAGAGPATGIDLTGRWLSLTQRCKGVGATQQCELRGQVEVRNQGSQKTPTTSFLRFYLSTDQTFDPGDTFLQQVTVGTLDPGKTQSASLSVRLPTGVNASGRFVIAVIDATNAIAETNEANNVIVSGPIP